MKIAKKCGEFVKLYQLRKKDLKGSGVFGKYFQITNKLGIKIIGRGMKSKKNLLKSKKVFLIAKEATYLKLAEKSGISPKVHDVVIARYKGKYYPGILMQHIKGKTAYNYDPYGEFKVTKAGVISTRGTKRPIGFVKSKLKQCKIIHKDAHYNNMIVNKSSIKVIDFSPDEIRYKGKKEDYDQINLLLTEKLKIDIKN